jgi:hypothetical protein
MELTLPPAISSLLTSSSPFINLFQLFRLNSYLISVCSCPPIFFLKENLDTTRDRSSVRTLNLDWSGEGWTFCVNYYWTMNINYHYQSCGKCGNTTHVQIQVHKFWSAFRWQLINAHFNFVLSSRNMWFVISLFSLRPVCLVALRRTCVSGDSVYIYVLP